MDSKIVELRNFLKTEVQKTNTIETDNLSIKFLEEPQLIYSKRNNDIIGIDATVNVFSNGVELEVDPHRICINPPTYVKVPIEQATREDIVVYEPKQPPEEGFTDKALYALRFDRWAAYKDWLIDSIVRTPNQKGFRTKGTVTTVYADASDTRAYGYSLSYSTARTTKYGESSTLYCAQQRGTGPTSYLCYQVCLEFDTSSIPDTDVVSQVDLMLDGTTDFSTNDFTAEARAYDWSSETWIAGDNLGNYDLLATWNSADYSSGYNTFTEEGSNFQEAIDKQGTTWVHISGANQRLNAQPSANEYVLFSNSETAGTTSDPKLVITHTIPPVEGSASLVGSCTVVAVGSYDFIAGVASLTASGTVVCSGNVVRNASANLSCSCSLSADGFVSTNGFADLACAGVVLAGATLSYSGRASLAGSCSVVARGTIDGEINVCQTAICIQIGLNL